MKHQDRRIRIIGGKWRGRKVSFPDGDELRPTPDRVRETLFNWLMQDIAGARCLELFAGSGALSLEALSRGAAHATIIEKNRHTLDALARSLKELAPVADSYSLLHDDALLWLDTATDPYDIIFLDPPFGSGALPGVISKISERALAAGWIYIESAEPIPESALPASWRLHRQKQAGAVHYCLCHVS